MPAKKTSPFELDGLLVRMVRLQLVRFFLKGKMDEAFLKRMKIFG